MAVDPPVPEADREPVRLRWWRRLSLRARLTFTTTAVVAVALVLGGLVVSVLLTLLLDRQVQNTARQRADEVAALVSSGQLPNPIPSGGAGVVQVLDSQGRVVAASAGGDRLVPILDDEDLAAVRAGDAVELEGRRIGISEPLVVVGTVDSGGGTVLVAVPLTDLQRSLDAIRVALILAIPLLVAGFAALSWALVGSALRPVETLTRGAASITGTGLHTESPMLPVPPVDDEIRRLAVTLNAMLERLRGAAARQRSFVSDAAHELRSPLASIRTGLEVAATHPESADWAATAADAIEDTARMARLVDDLLLLARLDEAGSGAGWCDLGEVVDGVVARVPARVPVQRSGSVSAMVGIDADATNRIITNLLTNAQRHAASAVAVEVRVGEGWVEVSVRDDGPGIAAEDRERVFQRFTRLDDARGRDGGGSGLGLAIVHDLVRSAGGSVVLGDAGPGLVAVVRLPARVMPTST